MKTAIAIVGYRNTADVTTCLEALTQSTAHHFSVHICENGGHPAAEALVKALAVLADPDPAAPDAPALIWSGRMRDGGQPVRVLCDGSNGGYAGGVNRCIEDARALPGWDALWVLNPDTQPAPEALAAMHHHLASGPYGIVGCRLVLKNTGPGAALRWTVASHHRARLQHRPPRPGGCDARHRRGGSRDDLRQWCFHARLEGFY